MKRIILYSIIFACLPFTAGWSYGIVDNTATRDTLSIPFAPLDSLGNAIDLADGDSIYIAIFSPGGTVVFKDSMAYNDASIKSYDWEDYAGGMAYVYTERVSVLDGASSAKGVFTYMLEVHDKTGAALKTRYRGQFQIVTSTLEGSLDSAGIAAVKSGNCLDSAQAQDDWIATEVTALKALDSLADVLDSLEQHDDWVASAAELAKVIDSLADVLDSLETISAWLQDSLYALLDTLQKWDTRIDSMEAALADASIGDKVWNEDTTGHYTQGTYGYEATGAGAGSPWSTGQRDSILNALIDSHIGDKVWTDGSFTIRAYITEARDSLRAQDDWIADATELGKALDSLGKLLDSAYAYDGWIAHQTTVDSLYDSLLIVLDSLEALEDWISKLTTSDNIGINLNDVSGTLDVGEIASTVYEEFWRNIDTTNVDTSLIGEWLTKAIWNAATRTLSALGFSLDATDYSGVSNLWNEGKSGFSLTASQWEEVWRNIDTTNIDTSEIGEWFTTGISASISDANMGAIGDTVWLKDTTGLYDQGTYGYEATTSAGCNCGDGAYTRYIVLLDSSNSDAPVPDASVFLNNLDQTLSNPYYNFTDANGTAIFQIDAGDQLVILINATGFQSIQDTMTTPAAISYDTVYTYSPADNKTLVWGVLQKADGTAYASAEVRIDLIAYPVDSTLTFEDTIIVQTIAYDTANSDGKWEIYLFSNDNLSDSSFYQFYFRDQYGDEIFRESGWLTHLPDTSSIKFNDCTRWRP